MKRQMRDEDRPCLRGRGDRNREDGGFVTFLEPNGRMCDPHKPGEAVDEEKEGI